MKAFTLSTISLLLAALLLVFPLAVCAEETTSDEIAGTPPAAPPAAIEDLFALKWYTAVLLAVLILLGILLSAGAKRTRWDSRRIANAAMCIAIAFILSCIKLYKMPQGGSITPAAMLPLIAFSLACGPVQGVLIGCAYGLLNLIQDPYVIHPVQMLVDYPLAYAALALGGLARLLPIKKELQLPAAVLFGAFGRYLMAVLSGTVFFAEYAPVGQSALVYSLVYNISYLGPDTVICILIALIPGMYRIVDLLHGNLRPGR